MAGSYRFLSLQPLQHADAPPDPLDVPDGAEEGRNARGFIIAGVSETNTAFDPRTSSRTCRVGRACIACTAEPDETARTRKGELLYVGKARSLRDRVGNYFLASNVDPKVQALVRHIVRIEVTLTNSETEALLLEYNLIKEHKPRYNIVLRDDKSFSVHLSTVRPRVSAAGVLSRRPQPAGQVFRPVSECRRRQGNAAERAEDLPHPELPRHLLRQPQPALPAAPDRALLGALREADFARGLCARHRGRREVLEGRNDEVFAELDHAMETAADDLQYERAAACATRSRRSNRCRPSRSSPADGDRTSMCLRWWVSPANLR